MKNGLYSPIVKKNFYSIFVFPKATLQASFPQTAPLTNDYDISQSLGSIS
jgi:hypothetical protein